MRFAGWRIGLGMMMGLLVGSTAQADWAFSPMEPGPTVFCRRAERPITVDGRLDEWKADDFQVVLDQAHMTGGNRMDPKIVGGDADCSGRVAVTWDGTFLYIGMRVRDDALAPVHPEKGYGNPWTHDGLMLYLHAHPGLERSGRYGKEYRFFPSNKAALLSLPYYQSQFHARQLPGRSRYVAKKTAAGYDLEAALELKSLGYRQAIGGDRLKLAMILVDIDPDAKGVDTFGQLVWQLGSAGSDSREWAELALLQDGWGAELIASVESTGERDRLVVKGSVQSVVPGLVFQGYRVVDKQGKIVHELKTTRRLKPNERVAVFAEADLPEQLADGMYTIQAVAAAGDEVQTRGPITQLEVVKHRKRVNPPATVSVPNPTRLLHTAYRTPGRPTTFKTVTKQMYVDFLKKYGTLKVQGSAPRFSQAWKNAHDAGLMAAYLYSVTKEPRYGEWAKAALASAIRWVKANPKLGHVHVMRQYLMVQLMRDSGLLTAADDVRVRDFLVTTSRRSCWGAYTWDSAPWRRGAGHSALGPAMARYYALRFYPKDVPADEAKLWRKYADLTWGDWWEHRDTIYNDTGYRSLFLRDIFATALLTDGAVPGGEDIFNDKEAKKFWERLLMTTAPNGAYPNYGDTSGWSAQQGAYIFIFEYLAAKTRDGRFKYAAHRIFDHLVNHSVKVTDYHFPFDHWLFSILYASLVTDDTVKPVAPSRASVLLTRKQPVPIGQAKLKDPSFGDQVYRFGLGPKEVPDKIVFKSDNAQDSLWAMIEVCGTASHNDVPETTHVAALIDRESVLTANQGYMDETPDLHNVILAEDLEGMRVAKGDMKISVPEFYDRSQAGYARVRVGDYHGWPIDEERQFLFGKHRFLVFKDTVTFKQDWMCRIGPCWQTQQVGPQVGTHWANTYVEQVFFTGLGLGRGCHRWKQPAWDLLVYHPPKDDCQLEIVNRYTDQPFRMLPVRLRYVWRGLARKGRQMHWTTILAPHEPVADSSQFADRIEVLSDTLKLTVLHLATGRYTEDWIVLNDTGKTVKVGGIETDARQVHIAVRYSKNLRIHKMRGEERSRHVMAEGGTFVKFKGKEIARAKRGKKIDTKF